MFENPRRGRQARNFTTNVPKILDLKSSSEEHIFSRKLSLGAPEFCADLFPARRCPSVIKFQIRLECAGVNRSNVLLISKANFPANKMN